MINNVHSCRAEQKLFDQKIKAAEETGKYEGRDAKPFHFVAIL